MVAKKNMKGRLNQYNINNITFIYSLPLILSRYEKKLDLAKSYGIKKGFINGLMMGFLWLVMNLAYALGFW